VDDIERMVLLHGFVKKTEQTPDEDIERAERWAKHEHARKKGPKK
jgi:phage-related protein